MDFLPETYAAYHRHSIFLEHDPDGLPHLGLCDRFDMHRFTVDEAGIPLCYGFAIATNLESPFVTDKRLDTPSFFRNPLVILDFTVRSEHHDRLGFLREINDALACSDLSAHDRAALELAYVREARR